VIRKHHILVLISFVTSAVLLIIATKGVRLADVASVIAQSHWEYALPMLASYAAFYWLKLVRWHYLLKPMREAKLRVLFSPMMLGFFANNLLPARLGEFVRMYLGAKTLALGNSQVLASIVLERVMDILVTVLFFGAALLLANKLPEQIIAFSYVAAVLSLALIGGLVVFTLWTSKILQLVTHLLRIFPERLQHKVHGQLELAASGLDAFRDGKLLAPIVLTSIGQWLFLVFAIQLSLTAVGIVAELNTALLVLVFTVVAVTIPSAPGFFGSIQAAYVFALIPAQVAEQNAIAASVFFHLFTYASVTLLGFYLLKRLNSNLHQIKVETESAKHTVEDSLN